MKRKKEKKKDQRWPDDGGQSNSQAPKFRKMPGGFVLRKERGLHLFHLPKGEIMQVSEEANQDQKEEN